MILSTQGLALKADAAIDLQLHTIFSDGKWTPTALIDYLQAEGFSLAAITDHDRADIAAELQKVAVKKQFPLLVAVEISSMWQGKLTDFLCYGFDPHDDDNALVALSQDIAARQYANTTLIIGNLRNDGYTISDDELSAAIAKPSSQQVTELVDLVRRHKPDDTPIGNILIGAGFAYATAEPAQVVQAAHQSDAICILAHPGGDEGFVRYDADLLDQLRAEAPIDGLEAHYPKHTPDQTQLFLDYAQQHDLLVSSGSDSHSIDKPPIKYNAQLSRKLLERLGIKVN